MNHAAHAIATAIETDRPLPPVSGTQRITERHELEVAVDLSSDHNFFTGLSCNVSEGGIFVATHNLLSVGTRVEIAFAIPNEESPIRVMTEVRWVREHNELSDTPPGMGLRFLELDLVSSYRVQRFIAAVRDAIFYED